jgi:hypothetical protein
MHRPSPQRAKRLACVRISSSATISPVDVELQRSVGLVVVPDALLGELDPDDVLPRGRRVADDLLLGRDAQEVDDIVELAALHEERVPAEPRALGEDDALRVLGELDLGEDLVRDAVRVRR